MKKFSGEKNNNWKGNDVGIAGIHVWLKTNFGNPAKCELCNLKGEVVNKRWNIHWAKIEGKEYQRKRNNFFGLCAKCHTKYDDKCPSGWNKGIKGLQPWMNITGLLKGNTGRTRFKKGMTPWNKKIVE